MPTTVAVLIGLIAAQLLLKKERVWLPQWLLRRQVSRQKLSTGFSWGRPVARFLDRFVHRRLTWLTGHVGMYLAAVMCIFIAATMPPLELLPFAASIAGGAVAAFGLSLMAEDGVVGLLALGLTAVAAALLIYQFFG
jgi:hypothetical protein